MPRAAILPLCCFDMKQPISQCKEGEQDQNNQIAPVLACNYLSQDYPAQQEREQQIHSFGQAKGQQG